MIKDIIRNDKCKDSWVGNRYADPRMYIREQPIIPLFFAMLAR